MEHTHDHPHAHDHMYPHSHTCSGQNAAAGNAEETKANIEGFKTAWNDALQNAVNDRMRGTTPKAGNGENLNVSSGFADVINDLHR